MTDLAALDNSVAKSPAVQRYWTDFCIATGLDPATPFQAWYFGNTPALAHELAELVLSGPKRATAGLAEFNDQMPAVKPVAGGYSVLTEFNGTPRAVIRTTELGRRRFAEVDAAFAWDEGEGDRTLADWKDGHRRFFTNELSAIGRPFDEGMEVDLERFELLYPFEAALNPVDCGPRLLPCLLPGAMAASAALQTQYYARDHGFGVVFEAGRLADIAEFVGRFDATRDGVWVAVDRGQVLGTIIIDGASTGDAQAAQLRWFIVADALRGSGMGRRMMSAAMEFAAARYARVVLGTFSALHAARHLYEEFGFRRTLERPTTQWGPEVLEQHWEWTR
ncbi:MAG TPA: GNAT family N-acetyltransferase [Burkholderiaceae bacterium]|nr:GNAT family N-acetyltransferase [Burkholderiaceae bacterium]HQR69697.1 GNAT family N-acetyltransferase [Burkholderiaceae bacterium]